MRGKNHTKSRLLWGGNHPKLSSLEKKCRNQMLGRDLDLGSDPDSEIACKRFLSKPPASTIEPKFIIPIRIFLWLCLFLFLFKSRGSLIQQKSPLEEFASSIRNNADAASSFPEMTLSSQNLSFVFVFVFPKTNFYPMYYGVMCFMIWSPRPRRLFPGDDTFNLKRSPRLKSGNTAV